MSFLESTPLESGQTPEERQAECEAAVDIIREFRDDPFLLRALMRCAPLLAATLASETNSPTASVGETMHQLRRDAFEFLRLMGAAPEPTDSAHPCPKCHGPCDPDWGCDADL